MVKHAGATVYKEALRESEGQEVPGKSDKKQTVSASASERQNERVKEGKEGLRDCREVEREQVVVVDAKTLEHDAAAEAGISLFPSVK